MESLRRQMLVCLFLIVATLVVFWQVSNHDFLNFDDNTYVTENQRVQAGFTGEGIIWAFTTTHANFWHPLTWLSYMLDCQLFGLEAGLHHLSNLLLHVANSILVFLVFSRMTGALWRSGLVAALFALHPFHVESVAWVSERKDTLSTLFWLLTMASYVWYVKRPGVNRYLTVLLFYVLGLMAKPMLVTLPFVLLLLDYWPLGRFQIELSGGLISHLKKPQQRLVSLRLVGEKMPLIVIAGALSVLAFLAQQSGGAIGSLDKYPISMRIANALVSYASYIGKMIWPQHLALPYPHPGIVPLWQAAGAGLFLLSASVLVVRWARKHPYLIVGWFWYLGTLVPVSGLVQVGSHAMADRYTYVPLIGLFIMVAWGVSDLVPKWRHRNLVMTISTGFVLSALMVTSWLQVGRWKNSVTLFTHTLKVTSHNVKAHNNLGTALLDQGRLAEAAAHFSEALRINPYNAALRYNLGLALLRQENLQEAVARFSEALRMNPNLMAAHRDLGTALLRQGKPDQAIVHYSEALRIEPDSAPVHHNLGNVLLSQGRFGEAIAHFSEVLRITPDYAARYNLGNALLNQGNLDEAIHHLAESLRMKPDNALAHNNMGNALARKGDLDEAVAHYSEALRIKPDDANVHYNLGIVLMRQGRIKAAITHFSEVLRIEPNHAKARRNLEDALQRMGKSNEVSKSKAKP
jgi:tetratricopeptide (TPR) repeat protein